MLGFNAEFYEYENDEQKNVLPQDDEVYMNQEPQLPSVSPSETIINISGPVSFIGKDANFEDYAAALMEVYGV